MCRVTQWRPIFVTGHVPLSHTSNRTERPDLPRIWLVRRFGACTSPRAFPKGALHLNGEPIASPFAPRFRCTMTLHLIPEPEEKASELLRDLTANDTRSLRGCLRSLTLPLRSRAHLRDYGSHEHPMLRHRSQRRRLGLDRPVPAGSPVGWAATHDRPARRP